MDAQIQARLELKILILGIASPESSGLDAGFALGPGLPTSPVAGPTVLFSEAPGDLRSGAGAGSGDPRTTSSGFASRARRMISWLMSRPKDSVGRACTDCETDRKSWSN